MRKKAVEGGNQERKDGRADQMPGWRAAWQPKEKAAGYKKREVGGRLRFVINLEKAT
jgi:hypothetical protein